MMTQTYFKLQIQKEGTDVGEFHERVHFSYLTKEHTN